MKLVLGVIDVPYAAAAPAAVKRALRWRHGKRPWQHLGGFTTTGDVAEILEARYSIMGTFYELHGDEIAGTMEDVIAGKFENLLMGAPYSGQIFEEGDLSSVEQSFRKFLDDEGMDGRAAGVPTAAALAGVNHRLKHPYAKGNSPRSSFIDSGLYQDSVRVWVID